MLQDILERLDKPKKSGKGYIARCPAHDDKTPSLSLVGLADGRILMHCFAGCDPLDVLTSIGLSLSDLFPLRSLGEFKSFQRINEAIAARQSPRETRDETLLALCRSDRENGKRLNQKELALEKQAFLRDRKVRNAVT